MTQPTDALNWGATSTEKIDPADTSDMFTTNTWDDYVKDPIDVAGDADVK